MDDKSYTPILVGAGIGTLLGWAHTHGKFPSAVEVGQTMKEPITWVLVGGYFLLGYAILYRFLQPQTTSDKALWLVHGGLWNLF